MTAMPFLRLLTLALICVLVAPRPAHAYLDPGTGSLLLQGLIGAIAGGLLMVRLYWARLRTGVATLMGRRKSSNDDASISGKE